LLGYHQLSSIAQSHESLDLDLAVFRRLRWAAWILFLGFSFYFTLDRAPHLNSFGHLLPKTEGPALVAIFAGFFEVMMREKTGLPRPTLGQLIPPRGASNDQLANRR